VTKAQRLIAIFAVFGIVVAFAYWVYLYASEGEAPSFSDIFTGAKGGFTAVTGIGKLSFGDLQSLASQAGFSDEDSVTMAAIALAESSGNPSAVGDLDITPGGSVGLWQINLKAHPELDTAALTDPATNAAAAYSVFQSQGFSAWSTYKNGAYEKYLPVQSADNQDSSDSQDDGEDS
jgi:Lysozyme like domain